MNVNLWQILCFLTIIIGATIVVFPTQRSMLPDLIDSGQYTSAGSIVEKLLNQTPRDVSVVDQAVRLYLLEGRPDQAIDRLETLHRQSPLTADRLQRLAGLYEWNRQPAKAQNTWERLLSIAPDHQEALKRLIGYYRYGGDLTRESTTIVRLVRLQKTLGQWQNHGKRLADLIALQISQLDAVVAGQSVPPLTAMLVSGLYQLYEKKLGEPSMDETISDQSADQAAMHRVLEQFVWTGHRDYGQAFAARADRLWDTGIDQQMQMVDVLRWSQMNQEALALLEQLHKEAPEDRRVLLAMTDTAKAMDNASAGIAAYQALIRLAPSDPGFRQQLMSLYQETGQAPSLFDEYERQFHATGDAQLLLRLFKLALQSGDPGLTQRALDLAARADADDPELLKQRADLHLAMDQAEKAYPLLKRIATGPGGSAADIGTMIRVAGYTNTPAMVADALTTAQRARPDDPDLLDQIASGWLAAGRPANAYDTLRRLTRLNGNRLSDIDRALDMAGQTGDPQRIADAIAWATSLEPDAPEINAEAISLFLAIGQAEKAYEQKANWVRRHQAIDQIPALIDLAESTGHQARLIDALQIGITLAPRDADLTLRLARLHLAQSRQPQAIDSFKRYLEIKPDDVKVQKELAQVYEWQGKPQQALVIYRQIVRAHPDDNAATATLARLMAETGDQAGLIALAIQKADAEPRNADLALLAGRALIADGQLEKGAVYLQRAAVLAPAQSVIWQELANVYQWIGESDRLIDALEHLAATGELDQHQTLLLAESYSNRRRWADVATLLGFVENRPVLPRREGLMLADAYMQMGRQAKARDLIQRLFKENRDDPVFLADLGERAKWQQRWDLALLIYEAVLKKDPVNLKALKGSGQIYAWTHASKPAIRALETYNRLYPHDYETQYLLGELYMGANRQADAQKQYRKAMRLINTGKPKDGTTPPVQEQAQP